MYVERLRENVCVCVCMYTERERERERERETERDRERDRERDGRVPGTVRVWSRVRVRERRTGYLSFCLMAFCPLAF